MVTGSLGLASSILRQIGGCAGFSLGLRFGGVAQDQGTPVSERVGVIGLGLVEGLVLLGGFGELLVLNELRDEGQTQVATRGGELDGLVEPGLGFGSPAHAGEGAAQSDQGFDVVGLAFGPLLVIGDETGLIVVSEEDLFDLASDFAMEPAIGPELGEHGLEVVESVLGSSEADFQVGGRDGELDLAERIGGFFRQCLEARQRGGGLIFLGEGGSDLFLDARVAGEDGFEAVPDFEGLVVFLGALVDAAQSLEDVEQIGASGFSGEGAFEGEGGVFGLADQDESLAEVVGGQGIVLAGFSAWLRAVTAAASWPRWNSRSPRMSQAVPSLGFLSMRSRYDLMKASSEPRSTWIAVDAVERRAAAGVFFEQREEPLHRPPLAGFALGGGVLRLRLRPL